MAAKPSMFELLRSLTDELSQEKTAALKRGESPDQGRTTHPSADGDDGTQAAPVGPRAKENERDVENAVGASSVDATEPEAPGTAKDDMPQIGVTASPTGEDPEVEDNYKDRPDDPGTEHPARADTGEKYGACSFAEGYQRSVELCQSILADLAVGLGDRLDPAGTTKLAQAQAKLQDALQSPTLAGEFAAGYELAAQLGLTKEAAEQIVADTLLQARKDGELDAVLYGTYVTELLKHAADLDDFPESREGESHNADKSESPKETPTGSSDDDAIRAVDDATLAQILAAAQGVPPQAEDSSSEPSDEEVLEELVQAMDELGVTPEELAAAVLEAGDTVAQVPMPAGAENPAKEQLLPAEEQGLKLAQAVRAYKSSGRYRVKEARTPQQRVLRDLLKNYVAEIVNI